MSVMMYIHNPSTLETEAGKVSEATLVYLDSSRPARHVVRPCLKQTGWKLLDMSIIPLLWPLFLWPLLSKPRSPSNPQEPLWTS